MLVFTLIGFVSGWILHKEFGDGESIDQCTQECCNRSIEKRQVDSPHHGMGATPETQSAEQSSRSRVDGVSRLPSHRRDTTVFKTDAAIRTRD